ncbi:MAG: hypothetical protein ACRCXZ_06220 [Patescibacteria group bacterium]
MSKYKYDDSSEDVTRANFSNKICIEWKLSEAKNHTIAWQHIAEQTETYFLIFQRAVTYNFLVFKHNDNLFTIQQNEDVSKKSFTYNEIIHELTEFYSVNLRTNLKEKYKIEVPQDFIDERSRPQINQPMVKECRNKECSKNGCSEMCEYQRWYPLLTGSNDGSTNLKTFDDCISELTEAYKITGNIKYKPTDKNNWKGAEQTNPNKENYDNETNT